MPTDDEKPCNLCGGKGVIEIDDLHSGLCACSKRRLFKTHMGPEIFAVDAIESPLYVLGEKRRQPYVDKTRSNCFIRADWGTLLPHLKWVLFYKGLDYRFRIVTDERILSVRLGKESSALKSKAERDAATHSFNALSDLVSEPHLVIIRLGFLGHKNVAAAGYLKEALMIREVDNKPTWVIEDPSTPFEEGHRTYSEEVYNYIAHHFEFMILGEEKKPDETESVVVSSSSDIEPEDVPEDDPPAPDEGGGMSWLEPKKESKPTRFKKRHHGKKGGYR